MPFAGLVEVGELSYNGLTFDNASNITCQMTPVMDHAKRTVSYVQYTINVTTILYSDTTTDFTMETIRLALSHNGGKLIFNTKGFGRSLEVDSTNDLKFGPLVQILSWTPIGSNKACEIRWSVVCSVPECDQSVVGLPTTPIAFNYTVSSEYNPRGDLTRTITGFLEIANNWKNDGNSLFQSPDDDAFRGSLNAIPMEGFLRTHRFHLNEAKDRLEFTITDTQIPSRNPWPKGIIHATGSQSVDWNYGQNGEGIKNFTTTIECMFDPERSTHPLLAYSYFHSLLLGRRNNLKVTSNSGGNNGNKQSLVFLTRLTIRDDLFGFPVSASATFKVMASAWDIIVQSGLFTPITFGYGPPTWRDWTVSTTDQHQKYGNVLVNALRHSASDDVMINACTGTPPPFPTLGTAVVSPPNQQQAAFTNDLPSKENSYMAYNLKVINVTNRPVSYQHILQPKDTPAGTNDLLANNGLDFGGETGTDPVIQVGGITASKVVLAGDITRAGHLISKAKIETIGGRAVEEIDSVHSLETTGDYFGVPVYRMRFMTTYAVLNRPGTIAPPPNLNDLLTGTIS